jgi:hypothetical protein
MEPNVLHRHHRPVLQPRHMCYTKYIPVLTDTRNFGISGAIKAQMQLKRSNQVLIQKCDQTHFSILQASSQLHSSLGLTPRVGAIPTDFTRCKAQDEHDHELTTYVDHKRAKVLTPSLLEGGILTYK